MGSLMEGFQVAVRLPLPRVLKKNAPLSLSMVAASWEMGLPSVRILARPR